MNITEFEAPKPNTESFEDVAGMCVYVREVLVGYIFFCHICMLTIQHLSQRFLCSGVSFLKYINDAKPAVKHRM